MENQQSLAGIISTLLHAGSSATSISYTLHVLLIKRRNFQAKQNQFFIFCILCNCLVRFMISSLFYKLRYVHLQSDQNKTLLQSSRNVLSETTIFFRSSHQRCSMKIFS